MKKIEATLLVGVLLAFGPVAGAQVRASLVAADNSVQPGKAVTLAVRLDHDPHWHTYWISAGTGYPTSLKWGLPAGWTAGSIHWPTPITIKNPQGDITGNGYEGALYLPVAVTAPAVAKPGVVTLKVHVKWLMCAESCIPGEGNGSLTLRVSADPPTPDTAVREALAKLPMPQSLPAWHIAAKRDGNTVTLQVTGAGGLSAPHFFSEDAFIQYDRPQPVSNVAGKVSMTLPIADEVDAATDRLVGVLAYTDVKGTYRGVQVSAPFYPPGTVASGLEATGPPSGSGSVRGSPVTGSTGIAQLRFFVVLMLAGVGGLVLNLMPCVFPVLGIKVMGFVNQAGSDRRKISIQGLVFAAGVLVSFWALATALAVLRAGGEHVGWGFQLQSPLFVFGLAVVMLIFAMSLSGVFEFGLGAMGVGSNLQMKDGYTGSFLTGVLATVVATPCSAPFLAPALGAALALPTVQSFTVFTAIAVGLSAPYLLLSIFPDAVKLLPRPGRWMETFKQAMAFPLYATVGFLVWVLAGQVSDNGLLMVLLGLTVIAMAVWLYGRYTAPGSSAARMRFGLMGGTALLVVGLNLGWPSRPAATDITWEPWSSQRITQLRAEGRPIYVDFTARWCATCQANKKVVFASSEVKRYFHDHHVVTLKADWTNADPRITAELAKWDRGAVPFNLVYMPARTSPEVLPEVLTPRIVLQAFKRGGS